MTPAQVVLSGFMFGSCLALGLMGAHVARAAFTITRAHRWPDFQRIR